MSVNYLIRFDDICPTMNWAIWSRIENLLVAYNINPILAVVPDNLDPNLVVETGKEDFWNVVRQWQQRGWSIALHGYHHVYETSDSGLMGLNARSEFAGLPRDVQRIKLKSALEIFSKQGVLPDAWIAPAHSFDKTTVELLLEMGVNVISDGFYHRPVRWLGALWIPQQLWKFKRMNYGLWTVCYHHNDFTSDCLSKFQRDINEFSSSIISLNEVIKSADYKDRSWLDSTFSSLWLYNLRLKAYAKLILQRCKLV